MKHLLLILAFIPVSAMAQMQADSAFNARLYQSGKSLSKAASQRVGAAVAGVAGAGIIVASASSGSRTSKGGYAAGGCVTNQRKDSSLNAG